jgi:LuxR family maltose regulon positive regulatory protein
VSLATARERGRQAVALAERYGWENRPILAPALGALGCFAVWMGEFDEAERWLHRAWEVAEQQIDPATAVLLHGATGMLHAARGQHQFALEEFVAAVRAQSLLTGAHVFGAPIAGWLATTQARLEMPDAARATLTGFSAEDELVGGIRTARASVCIAEGDPGAALELLQDVLDAAPSAGLPAFGVVEAHLHAGVAHLDLGDRKAAAAAAEAALAAAEPDRLIFPFAMIGTAELLDVLPRPRNGSWRPSRRHHRHAARRTGTEHRSRPSVATRRVEPQRTPRTAIPADKPHAAGDRARALRLHQHREHTHPQHLLQARGARSLFRRSTRARVPAPLDRALLNIGKVALGPSRAHHQIPALRAH